MNYKIISKSIFITLVLISFTACNSYKNANMYKSNPEATKDENNLLAKVDRLSKKIDEHENTQKEDKYNKYPNEILQRLLKDDKLISNSNINFDIKVIKNPSVNAFALPNGKIYIHTGLLSLIENEAQLALLIAHEMNHVLYKHSLKQQANAKAIATFGQLFSVLSSPFDGGIIGALIQVSSIYGYSQQHEKESDEKGYQQIVQAGYDPQEASKLFNLMLENIKLNKISQPYFFSTHPKVEERIESSKSLIEKYYQGKTGIVKDKIYQAYSKNILINDIELNLKLRKFEVANYLIKKLHKRYERSTHSNYFQAEYMRLTKDNSFENTLQKYNEALEIDTSYYKAYRGIGYLYFELDKKEEAKDAFKKYLSLNENAKDKNYIQYYINQCEKGKKQWQK